MGLRLVINGEQREFDSLDEGASLADLIAAMRLKADRVAVERNGEIAARSGWAGLKLTAGDRLEVVHFVGGGGGI